MRIWIEVGEDGLIWELYVRVGIGFVWRGATFF